MFARVDAHAALCWIALVSFSGLALGAGKEQRSDAHSLLPAPAVLEEAERVDDSCVQNFSVQPLLLHVWLTS